MLGIIVEDETAGSPTPDEVAPWCDYLELTFPVLSDTQGAFLETYSSPSQLFVFYLLDEDGRIVWRELGEDGETLDRVTVAVQEALGK